MNKRGMSPKLRQALIIAVLILVAILALIKILSAMWQKIGGGSVS